MAKSSFHVVIPDYQYWKQNIKCQTGCPVNTDSRGYVQAIARGDYEQAYWIARTPNPLASICGRVCAAPCELACRRGWIDAAVSIRALKRFVTQRYGVEIEQNKKNFAHDFVERIKKAGTGVAGLLKSAKKTTKPVSIVGAGPAGLSCAHELALMGYSPVIYEMEKVAGGMCSVGIPAYRLPREIIQAENEAIKALGVEIKLGVPWIWTAIVFNTAAFLLFLVPKMRNNIFILNIGCVLIFIGVWIEKGMGLVIPGFIPDTAGEIYEYSPSPIEWIVFLGICAFGAMTYTLFARAAIAIDTGKLRHPEAPPVSLEESEDITARTVMTRNLITATSDTTVEEISKLLVTHRISGVPVVDRENRVIGVVSESDIILKEIYSEPRLVERLGEIIMPPSRQRVKTGGTALEIMTSPAITALEETPVRELVQIISDNKIKRVIIVDKEGHPKGIVSRMDVVRVF